jgi:hypothetical protein
MCKDLKSIKQRANLSSAGIMETGDHFKNGARKNWTSNTIWSIVAGLLLGMSACSSPDFSKVKTGMTKTEVESLVGKPQMIVPLPLQEVWCWGKIPQTQIIFSNDTVELLNIDNRELCFKGVDKDGNVITYENNVDEQSSVSSLSPKENAEGKWGYVDETGKAVIPFKYDHASDFEYGYAEVVIKNRNWDGTSSSDEFLSGIIDAKGETVVDFKYVHIFPLDGVFCFQDGFLGLMDLSGNIVVEPQYEGCAGMVGDNIQMRKDGKWILIDKKGNVVDDDYDNE